MRQTFIAIFTGIIFGAGLAISDMVNPERVLAFFNIYEGWDPTLAFVIGGALIPAAIAFALSRRMREPFQHTEFHIPENRIIDRQLIAGAAIFGAGWGLVGYCPGPAIAGMVFGDWQPFVFAAAMIAGMWLHRQLSDLKQRSEAAI